jgi:hypothetical protein
MLFPEHPPFLRFGSHGYTAPADESPRLNTPGIFALLVGDVIRPRLGLPQSKGDLLFGVFRCLPRQNFPEGILPENSRYVWTIFKA